MGTTGSDFSGVPTPSLVNRLIRRIDAAIEHYSARSGPQGILAKRKLKDLRRRREEILTEHEQVVKNPSLEPAFRSKLGGYLTIELVRGR